MPGVPPKTRLEPRIYDTEVQIHYMHIYDWVCRYYCNKITDAGMVPVGKLRQLTNINLTGCHAITSAGRTLVPCLRR